MKKRYFLIGYVANCVSRGDMILSGNVRFSSDNFPSNSFIRKTAVPKSVGHNNLYNVTVMSIYEFKTKKDFDNFNGE